MRRSPAQLSIMRITAPPLAYVMPSKAFGMSSVALDGLADLARGNEAVFAHRPEPRPARRSRRSIPASTGQHLGCDPRGERFVEPDVVPPGDRYEVAEPLVGQFVRRDARVRALALGAILRGLGEDEGLAVGDQSRVFHRAAEERHRDSVQFSYGYGMPK